MSKITLTGLSEHYHKFAKEEPEMTSGWGLENIQFPIEVDVVPDDCDRDGRPLVRINMVFSTVYFEEEKKTKNYCNQ